MKKTFERIVNYLKKKFPGVHSITLVPLKSASWKTFKFGMEITTETRSSKLADENVKWGVVFESGYYALQPLAAWITRTSVKVGKIRLLLLVLPRVQERSSEQLLTDHSRVSDDTKLSLRWQRWSKRASLHCMWVLFEYFYKNNASHHKQRQLNCCFLSLFYF